MGVLIECPESKGGCGSRFHVHGFERTTTCENCGTTFNPQEHPVLDWDVVGSS